MSTPEHAEAELRHHAASLRSLARDLLRDSHAADDVTQETLHAALAHRELRSGPLGGWLHRVLENFARQWQRGERRRTARHRNLLTPDPEPAPDESLMRRESLRAVTDAVLQLDEPYQTAIFLRYFEDLPPRAICKRTGATLATVKSRLQRGLVMLRQKLDRQRTRDGHDWCRALAATFALPFAAGATIGITTGVLMGTTSKFAIAAAVVCAGSLFAWRLLDDPAPAPHAAHAASVDPRTTSGAVVAENDTPAQQREAAKETAPPAPWLEHPFELGLDVIVLDATGLPCEGRTIRLAPPDVQTNDAPVTTGPDGRASVTWPSRTATGEVVVKDDQGLLVRVPLQHGHRTLLALGGAEQKTIARSGFRITSESTTAAANQAVEKLMLDRLLDRAGPQGTMRSGLHPNARFGDNAGLLDVLPVTLEPKPREVVGISFSFGSVDRITFPLDVDVQGAPATEPPSIRGTVFDANGKPAAKTPVALLGSSPQPLQRITTDDDGHFVFENCVEGTFTVRAGGASLGLGTATAIVTRGRTPVRVDLRHEASVRGRIVRSDNSPAIPYRVVWRAADGSWCDETTTADDNTFVFPNLPAVPGNVYAWPVSSTALPVAFATHVLGDTGELVLRHDVEAGHRIAFEPLLPEECRTAAIEARVWQIDTGLGVTVPRPEDGKPWELGFPPPGWYQIEVRAPGCGFVDLGRHWLDGKSDLELGRRDLPRPGRVTFVVPGDVLPENGEHLAFEITEVRRDLDVRIDTNEIPTDRPMFLPAGDYAFGYRHREGSVKFVPFTVRSGEETVVTAQ